MWLVGHLRQVTFGGEPPRLCLCCRVLNQPHGEACANALPKPMPSKKNGGRGVRGGRVEVWDLKACHVRRESRHSSLPSLLPSRAQGWYSQQSGGGYKRVVFPSVGRCMYVPCQCHCSAYHCYFVPRFQVVSIVRAPCTVKTACASAQKYCSIPASTSTIRKFDFLFFFYIATTRNHPKPFVEHVLHALCGFFHGRYAHRGAGTRRRHRRWHTCAEICMPVSVAEPEPLSVLLPLCLSLYLYLSDRCTCCYTHHRHSQASILVEPDASCQETKQCALHGVRSCGFVCICRLFVIANVSIGVNGSTAPYSRPPE